MTYMTEKELEKRYLIQCWDNIGLAMKHSDLLILHQLLALSVMLHVHGHVVAKKNWCHHGMILHVIIKL